MSTLENQIQNYLSYSQINKKLDPKTLKAYRIDLNQFISIIPSTELPITKDTIMVYLTKIHKLYQPRTIKRKIASIKAFFHYLEYEDLIETNPFNKIDLSFRQPKYLPKTIPSSTIQQFLSTLYKEKTFAKTATQQKTILRDIAVIELLFATGMRISELCSLKQTDIDLQNKHVLIFGKGAKERMLQISNPDVLKALINYQNAFSNELSQVPWFFVNRLNNRLSEQSVRLMIKHYCELAGIPMHITPHMFRHSFATLLLEADVDIRYIQKMLGHSSITVTEIYTHVALSKQKAILTTKHPRQNFKI